MTDRASPTRAKDERRSNEEMDRRTFLVRGAAGALALPLAGSVIAGLAGCGSEEPPPRATAPGAEPEPVTEAPPSPPAQVSPEQPPAQAQAPAAPAEAPPAAGGDASQQLVTEVPAMAGLVSSLQYVNASPNPDKHCNNCQLYTATSEERGKCQLFPQGLVAAQGYCTSWIAKQA